MGRLGRRSGLGGRGTESNLLTSTEFRVPIVCGGRLEGRRTGCLKSARAGWRDVNTWGRSGFGTLGGSLGSGRSSRRVKVVDKHPVVGAKQAL